MHRSWRAVVVILAVAAGGGCARTQFKSSWTDPDAMAGELQGKRVAAFAITSKPGSRGSAEDTLARELTKLGVEAVPGHKLNQNITPSTDGNTMWSMLNGQGIDGAVVMRVVQRRDYSRFLPAFVPGGPTFIPPGLLTAQQAGMFSTAALSKNTIVSVETVVYSVADRKPLWRGVSETFDPLRVDSVIKNSADDAARQLRKAGLIGHR